MKKISVLLLALSIALSLCSCGTTQSRGSAEDELSAIIEEFGLGASGSVYSDSEGAERELSDKILSAMFSSCGSLGAFRYVVSRAAYFSLRFSGDEIVVFELTDRSHREEIYSMCMRRAAKKKNATVYADGNYVYLICTDFNSDVTDYIRKR